jgi:Mn2+/Fe2+ NRAMP family transporter
MSDAAVADDSDRKPRGRAAGHDRSGEGKSTQNTGSIRKGAAMPRLFRALGPGLITGASDDDPSGLATYSQAGAQFGFTITWTLLFTYPLMAAIQEISGRIGRTTGRGIAANIARHYPNWTLQSIVALLLVANVINIGADLGAMGDALQMLFGGPRPLYVVLFGCSCALLQVLVVYTRYVAGLKWLTLSLFAYFGTVLAVNVPWAQAAWGFLVPTFSTDASFWTTVVAILGTTISPYLFFWQASPEVEDIRAVREREPLLRAPHQGDDAKARIAVDTYIGMAFSNIVALAIMVTTAATLHTAGATDIQTSRQAAEALRPVAGDFAFALFALGIIGTGLLAVPVLAGTAAYALGEARKWPTSLARRPIEAKGFYATIRHGNACRHRDQSLADRSDQSALLERGHQRRRRSARHGNDDADRIEQQDHGRLCHWQRPATDGVVGDCGHGRRRRRHGHHRHAVRDLHPSVRHGFGRTTGAGSSLGRRAFHASRPAIRWSESARGSQMRRGDLTATLDGVALRLTVQERNLAGPHSPDHLPPAAMAA